MGALLVVMGGIVGVELRFLGYARNDMGNAKGNDMGSSKEGIRGGGE